MFKVADRDDLDLLMNWHEKALVCWRFLVNFWVFFRFCRCGGRPGCAGGGCGAAGRCSVYRSQRAPLGAYPGTPATLTTRFPHSALTVSSRGVHENSPPVSFYRWLTGTSLPVHPCQRGELPTVLMALCCVTRLTLLLHYGQLLLYLWQMGNLVVTCLLCQTCFHITLSILFWLICRCGGKCAYLMYLPAY